MFIFKGLGFKPRLLQKVLKIHVSYLWRNMWIISLSTHTPCVMHTLIEDDEATHSPVSLLLLSHKPMLTPAKRRGSALHAPIHFQLTVVILEHLFLGQFLMHLRSYHFQSGTYKDSCVPTAGSPQKPTYMPLPENSRLKRRGMTLPAMAGSLQFHAALSSASSCEGMLISLHHLPAGLLPFVVPPGDK